MQVNKEIFIDLHTGRHNIGEIVCQAVRLPEVITLFKADMHVAGFEPVISVLQCPR
jgi:hypothetical protein